MQNTSIVTIQPKRILVITLRFLGDTLLATPLISSLKQAYADATVDVLTFKANVAMLEGNPDINKILTLDERPKTTTFAKLLISLFQKYDLAISTQAGDRPVLCAIMAGRISLGFIIEEPSKTWWKKYLLTRCLIYRKDYNHAVLENLRFCHLLGIEPSYKLTPPQNNRPISHQPPQPYAVLHIKPQWRYKEWHRPGWHALIKYLTQHHLHIIITGSKQTDELIYLDNLLKDLDIAVTNLAGQLSLAELTDLTANATMFVGPDTGITHLAAATGVPTFALFGPTDPKKWAPWPCGYTSDQAPFSSTGTQRKGNVYLIQGKNERNCVPCQQEGCENHRDSHSACLDNLPATDVLETIAQSIDMPTKKHNA